MPRNPLLSRASLGILLTALTLIAPARAQSGPLRVGTAKIDITPAELARVTTLWEVPYTGIHDRTYARILVLDNGASSAAILAVDSVEITHAAPLVERIARETGIPASQILIAASHAHSAPMLSLVNAEGQRHAGPGGAAFLDKVFGDIVAGVKQAKASMQPARFGSGSGLASVNINRDEPLPGGGFGRGPNPDGPSDKTVWVLKFESLTGEPLAFLVNYAVHATIVGPGNSLLSADLPGAAAGYIEKNSGGKAIALWTTGPAGDQHPILDYFGKDSDEAFRAVEVLGQILGREALRVSKNTLANSAQIRIQGAAKNFSCPGQVAITGPRPAAPFLPKDNGTVTFPMGVLMIGNTALAEVGAEVNTVLYWQLRKKSPFTNTLLITLANGRAGYIPEDDAYTLETEEATGSAFKKGCAATTVVNGLTELLQQF